MQSPWVILGTGFLAGVLSGLLGLGGGIIVVPVMVTLWAIQPHVAMATSLAMILPTAIIGCFLYQAQGNLDLLMALKIIIGSVAGAYCGATLAGCLSASTLKKSFGGMVVIIGIRMVIG